MSDLCNDIDDNISPTESETHAVGVAGVVVVVVVDSTCCVDIVEVGSVVDIRRTQPPTRLPTHRETLCRMNPIKLLIYIRFVSHVISLF